MQYEKELYIHSSCIIYTIGSLVNIYVFIYCASLIMVLINHIFRFKEMLLFIV